jgi:putative ribosome biogenesis GTPase RsgA
MIERLKKCIDTDKDTVIILAGESGAGKSTFCNFINQPNLTYTSSGALIDELTKK